METKSRIDLVLIDANRTARRGTELLLRESGHVVTGSTGDVTEGIELVRRRLPRVVVLDLDVIETAPAAIVERLHHANPSVGVVLHVGAVTTSEITDALKAGASGLVSKTDHHEVWLTAVESVAAGHKYASPAIDQLAAGATARARLSPRERDVLQLLADGRNGEGASSELAISPETVRTHLRNAMRKLGARTRVHAVVLAAKHREILA